ncbi:uncharacterized protein N7482_003516 [Penicillium canariense]|uniref:Zinc finger Mcm10/DnaG-type domain-containing protein n=1 Tax=Penicillium canariense TaxID=189055 RepID=A0A9W9LNQ7_9EURO|nr:uncharacterized protein N7482_003516 [Penicillium canariense]KAJ5167922.1 hypothetical protein N7482_003516 [Penicillium canariense]
MVATMGGFGKDERRAVMVDSAWPPKSPRDALLSSPGGRRKYEDMQQRRQLLSSPLKRSSTTPNFRSKAGQVLDEGEDEDDSEEDEETLQLQLAEIKARLKLKQLQKSRGRSGTASSRTEDGEEVHARPSSGIIRSQSHASIPRSPGGALRKAPTNDVQVPVSPTRRDAPAPEPWSPRRYKMGIDKGWKAGDVSLKRPPRPTSQLETRSGAMSRSSDVFSARPQTSPSSGGLHRIKSFSERMAEGRAAEKSRMERAEKAERVHASRSSGFQLDNSEIEAFKAAAATEKPSTPSSVSRGPQAPSFSREDILRSIGPSRSGIMKRSQTTPNIRNMDGHTQALSHKVSEETEQTENPPDPSKFESYSGLHLSNRILPHSFLSRSLADKTTLKIPDLLKTVKAPAFELPEEIDGDFVVFGIVASKSDTKQTKDSGNASAKTADPYDDGMNNTNSYMAMTLTDLKWTIDLFLFDTAFPRYYKISEGTLIAILNPTIMPPPKHKLDTNRFSLCLSSSDDKVLEIGKAQDIGFCKAVRKDGKTCQSWVDGRKTEFCDFHVDLQVRRTQGARSGVNSGTGMFGPGGKSGSRTGIWNKGSATRGRGRGLLHGSPEDSPYGSEAKLKPEGARYDFSSQSVYYVAPGPKNGGAGRASFNPAAGHSAANMLDANDDPFIAAGMMGRGMENKEERMRRRLAAQQRERDITQKLVAGRSGGVGAEYLRSRTANESPASGGNKDRPPGTPPTPKALPSSQSLNWTTSGKAKDVRLSPMKRAHDGDKPHGSGVKKTRFITSKGIREAGRDSLGGDVVPIGRVLSDDDDDDLELV